MSYTEHYIGILKPVNNNYEEFLKKLFPDYDLTENENKEETALSVLLDKNTDHDNKFIVVDNKVYEIIILEEVDESEDICIANMLDDNNIHFQVKFYNGGTYLEEAITEAVEVAKKKQVGEQIMIRVKLTLLDTITKPGETAMIEMGGIEFKDKHEINESYVDLLKAIDLIEKDNLKTYEFKTILYPDVFSSIDTTTLLPVIITSGDENLVPVVLHLLEPDGETPLKADFVIKVKHRHAGLEWLHNVTILSETEVALEYELKAPVIDSDTSNENISKTTNS